MESEGAETAVYAVFKVEVSGGDIENGGGDVKPKGCVTGWSDFVDFGTGGGEEVGAKVGDGVDSGGTAVFQGEFCEATSEDMEGIWDDWLLDGVGGVYGAEQGEKEEEEGEDGAHSLEKRIGGMGVE